MAYKGTKGKYSYSPQIGEIGHCHTAQVWDLNGKSLAILEATENESEATAGAEIIADALNVSKIKTGLLPSEILKQRDEAVEMLKLISRKGTFHQGDFDKISNFLKSITESK